MDNNAKIEKLINEAFQLMSLENMGELKDVSETITQALGLKYTTDCFYNATEDKLILTDADTASAMIRSVPGGCQALTSVSINSFSVFLAVLTSAEEGSIKKFLNLK